MNHRATYLLKDIEAEYRHRHTDAMHRIINFIEIKQESLERERDGISPTGGQQTVMQIVALKRILKNVRKTRTMTHTQPTLNIQTIRVRDRIILEEDPLVAAALQLQFTVLIHTRGKRLLNSAWPS